MLQGEVVEQVRARYQAIVDHHVALTVRSQDVLVLDAFGFEVPEIVRMLGTSENTVRHQLHRARADAVPPELPATRGNAAVWVALHQRCCMATAIAALGLRGNGQN